MITLVNTSGGNLHLESLGLIMGPGERMPFEIELHELLVRAPELALYVERGRALVVEEPKKAELAPEPLMVVEPEPPAVVEPDSDSSEES